MLRSRWVTSRAPMVEVMTLAMMTFQRPVSHMARMTESSAERMAASVYSRSLHWGTSRARNHGGQGVVKAEQLGIGQEVAGHRAYERTEHPAAVGGEVGGVHQRKPRLLTCGHGHAVHGENLVREPPADDELLEAGERREPRGHGGGHEHMPQVDHERRENDGKDGRAHPP